MNLREWLETALEDSELTEEAKDYLMGRGATSEIIDDWKITCFDPPEEPCPDSGLKRFGPRFDIFEGKVVYPLFSPRGKLLGFDSRSVDQKNLIRFLLPDAHWTVTWIGMPHAMQGIWEHKTVYIVEGIFDVFALHHADPNGVVLGSGPARLSFKQTEFIRRWVSDVGVIYDRDDTGRRGTELALKNLRYHGVSCREILYRGKDPGDIWDRGGVEAVREAFPHL